MFAVRSLLLLSALALLAVSSVAVPPPGNCNLDSSECTLFTFAAKDNAKGKPTGAENPVSIQIWYNPLSTTSGTPCNLDTFTFLSYSAASIPLTGQSVALTNGEITSLATSFPLNGGGTVTIGETTTGSSLVGTNPSQLAQIVVTPTGQTPATYTVSGSILSQTCYTAAMLGDPVLSGFHGQHFIVKGEAGAVFNLISSPNLSFNNRFVALESQNSSMSAVQQHKVRSQFKQPKQSKLLDMLVQMASDNTRPPVTTAWNHPGTYLGESGLTLGESQLYIAPGSYETGFSSVTLNGVALPISSVAVELDGDMTITHLSAWKVRIATPDVRFTIVNSDKFVNIEHAVALSSDAKMTGLLGETVDREWEVVQSEEFLQHIEADFKLASNDLFGNDFPGKQF